MKTYLMSKKMTLASVRFAFATIALMLAGTAHAQVALSPTSVDFGAVEVDETEIQTITLEHISNSNGDRTWVNSIVVSGAGFVDAGTGTCAATPFRFMNVGDTCTVDVQMAPTAIAALAGDLSIAWDANHNSPAGSASATLTGSGSAVSPVPPTTRSLPTPPQQIPTLSTYGLVLTMLGLFAVAARRLRGSAKRK